MTIEERFDEIDSKFLELSYETKGNILQYVKDKAIEFSLAVAENYSYDLNASKWYQPETEQFYTIEELWLKGI